MSNSPSGVDLVINDTIATITLNIPEKHNSLNSDNIQQFCGHIDQVATDNSVRVLIVTAAGEKTFCAGAALDQLGSGSFKGDHFVEIPDKLAELTIPTICAFNGNVYGGGSDIGLSCDFRIGAPDMRLFIPPARIGLCYPVNGIERFTQILGPTIAKRLFLASEEFNGKQLLELGYLTHTATKGETLSSAQTLAQRMADYAPLSLKAMKQICNQAARNQLDKEQANQLAAACNASEDLKEGFLAKEEKRKPVFNGR